MSPYDQFNAEIQRLIRQGCTPNQATQELIARYPQLVNQAAQLLKRAQAIERQLNG